MVEKEFMHEEADLSLTSNLKQMGIKSKIRQLYISLKGGEKVSSGKEMRLSHT